MLLIDKQAYKSLTSKAGFSWKDIGLAYPIDKIDFEYFKDRFEKRMDRSGHGADKKHQFFRKQDIQAVIDHSETDQVAFVFVTNPRGQKLRAAMIGRNGNGFYSGPIFLSTENPSQSETIPTSEIKTLQDGSTAYLRRLSPTYPRKPERDMGIFHQKSIINIWLNDRILVTGEVIRVYFGIDDKYRNPELQNTMLIDDASFGNPGNVSQYAFDKGGGCCP